VLRVPSVLVPEEFNYLFNPSHPDAKQLVEGPSRKWQLDQRLAGCSPVKPLVDGGNERVIGT